MESILNLEPVNKKGMKLLISLYGMSETGKTLSALKLACGLEPDPNKRVMIDTEGGQRGRAYVDQIPGGYLYGSLTPPFTPERYIQALDECRAAGATVVVIDSISHVWGAEGGILDMVEQATEKNDMAKWAKPKRRLTKFTNRMMSCDMHVILCARAKQPMIEEFVDGRKKLLAGPVVPIQEKNLRYDMTIMAQMLGRGKFTVEHPAGKCPGPLLDVFAQTPLMSEETGKALKDWIGEQSAKSQATRNLEDEADRAAEMGTEVYRSFYEKLDKQSRQLILAGHENRKSIAAAVTKEAEDRAEAELKAKYEAPEPDPFEASDDFPGDRITLTKE